MAMVVKASTLTMLANYVSSFSPPTTLFFSSSLFLVTHTMIPNSASSTFLKAGWQIITLKVPKLIEGRLLEGWLKYTHLASLLRDDYLYAQVILDLSTTSNPPIFTASSLYFKRCMINELLISFVCMTCKDIKTFIRSVCYWDFLFLDLVSHEYSFMKKTTAGNWVNKRLHQYVPGLHMTQCTSAN